MTHHLTTHELAQGYRGTPVFSDLDLDIAPGLVGLLGPNGAGKTTLLRTLATVTPPVAGTVGFGGNAARSPKELAAVRREIGYLPQSFGCFRGFSVVDFVAYCGWLRGMSSRAARRDAERVVDGVGLAGRGTSTLRRLSGGMLRRAGIAAAVVGSPRYVFLDEPTVGLDPEQRVSVRELLREVTDGVVLLSTHLTDDVAAVCDRTLVFAEGRVRFDGTPAELAALGAGADSTTGGSDLERGYLSVLRACGDR